MIIFDFILSVEYTVKLLKKKIRRRHALCFFPITKKTHTHIYYHAW